MFFIIFFFLEEDLENIVCNQICWGSHLEFHFVWGPCVECYCIFSSRILIISESAQVVTIHCILLWSEMNLLGLYFDSANAGWCCPNRSPYYSEQRLLWNLDETVCGNIFGCSTVCVGGIGYVQVFGTTVSSLQVSA